MVDKIHVLIDELSCNDYGSRVPQRTNVSSPGVKLSTHGTIDRLMPAERKTCNLPFFHICDSSSIALTAGGQEKSYIQYPGSNPINVFIRFTTVGLTMPLIK